MSNLDEALATYRAEKLGDFERHMRAIFARSMPFEYQTKKRDGSPDYGQPTVGQIQDCFDRLAVAVNIYGPAAIGLLRGSGQLSREEFEERFPDLVRADNYKKFLPFDPDKMDWKAAAKAAEKHVDAFISLQQKIEARGGVTQMEAMMINAGLMKL